MGELKQVLPQQGGRAKQRGRAKEDAMVTSSKDFPKEVVFELGFEEQIGVPHAEDRERYFWPRDCG